jgi:DNA-directed RNA polymerase omega subunit
VARITIEDCLKRVKNRFLLVNMAVKRVRQIREGSEYLVSSPKNEDIVVSLREIAAGKITIREGKEEEIKGEIEKVKEKEEDTGIVTTEDETEGYNIVKAIVREVVDVKRVYMRDTKSYCGILFDDNNRKPICRLHFNTPQKSISLFTQKEEERVSIDSVDDIFKYSERLKEKVKEYL